MRTETYDVTLADLRGLVTGGDGADLERIPGTTTMRIIDTTPSTRAWRYGARNGDVIESINGLALSSVAAGYEAAARAMKEREITIRGTRDGEPFVTVLRVTA